MTFREWRSDRRAVFERDEYACGNCGTAGDDGDPTNLRTYPVGDVPPEGTVHVSSLVTVCSGCFTVLQDGAEGAVASPDREALFDLVRGTTRTQGATIADVASFASLVTSLPAAVDEEADVDEGADANGPLSSGEDGSPDPGPEYVETRRSVLLSIDLVDARLDQLAGVVTDELEPPVPALLGSTVETASTLQADLREVVELGETVVAGCDRCHGCFASVGAADEPCGICGLVPRETADWRRSDGEVATDRLFAAINDTLRGTSETTEALTDRAMRLAEALTED